VPSFDSPRCWPWVALQRRQVYWGLLSKCSLSGTEGNAFSVAGSWVKLGWRPDGVLSVQYTGYALCEEKRVRDVHRSLSANRDYENNVPGPSSQFGSSRLFTSFIVSISVAVY
jgi:hypothetical protein